MGINFNAGNNMNITVMGDQNISEVSSELDKLGLKAEIKEELLELAKTGDKSRIWDFLEKTVPAIAGKVFSVLIKAAIL